MLNRIKNGENTRIKARKKEQIQAKRKKSKRENRQNYAIFSEDNKGIGRSWKTMNKKTCLCQ